ncbi:MAG: hypothetical protein OEZ68_22045 [Gammaproteobacteria bacterium]|nr:hypothetical protein [Gammaproteobacteria bacterium]MDH5803469.1 hypothetical protein [Gammaproteobacteria bacterium]
MTKQEIAQNIASVLNTKSGQLARDIARDLGLDKKEVNSVLYGSLKGKFYQDKSYRWWPNDDRPKASKEEKLEKRADTPLAKLCQYYLACMGRDDEGGISAFAFNKYGPSDYVELETLSTSSDTLFELPNASALFKKVRGERGRLTMHFGYPTNLKKIKSSRSSWEGFVVEPILLFPVELGQSISDTPVIDVGAPIINMSVLKQYSNSEREAVMNELILLEEELGIRSADVNPDLDELAQRLRALREEWLWVEDINPESLLKEPVLAECTEPGIYNRAVLIVSERSPYTQGLESD